MATESKLSVIVPVYNVKEYLNECIDSILAQSYQNLEVLLIVNAPTDGSDKICEEYAEKDKRIKLLYIKENHGVYPAWYLGGISATGEYTTFVDADDYVDSGYFQKMLEVMEGYDIVASYHTRVTGWDSTYKDKMRIEPGDYSTKGEMDNIVTHMFDQNLYIFFAPWAKIYKTTLIKSAMQEITDFTPGGVPGCCDYAILFASLVKCSSLRFLDSYGYNYRMRRESESRRINHDFLIELDSFYKGMQGIFEKDRRKEILINKLEQFVQKKILLAGRYLGFADENRIPQFFLPFPDRIKDKTIALYSATDVACDYRWQINRSSLCKLRLWVSGNWEERRKAGLPVDPVNELLNENYDYVVIAVKREATANSIIRDLVNLGINREKMLWQEPIFLFD